MEGNTPQASGKPITIDEHGQIDVPEHPIISFTQSESAVWGDVSHVLDAAVEKAYEGERQIVWQPATSDKQHDTSCIGFALSAHTDVLSLLVSGILMLRHMKWFEAADILQNNMNAVIQSQMIPQGSPLFCECEKISTSDFCAAVVEHIHDEAIFDVDAAQYDALAAKFKEEFEAATENTVEIAKKAMEKARQKLTEAGQFTEEKGEKLKGFLENDLLRVSEEMKKGAKAKLNPSRLSTGALASISKLLHKTGEAFSHFAEKADASLSCKSGEITSAGRLTCKACGHEMHFKKTGRIPPCPKCHKTEFTKGY